MAPEYQWLVNEDSEIESTPPDSEPEGAWEMAGTSKESKSAYRRSFNDLQRSNGLAEEFPNFAQAFIGAVSRRCAVSAHVPQGGLTRSARRLEVQQQLMRHAHIRDNDETPYGDAVTAEMASPRQDCGSRADGTRTARKPIYKDGEMGGAEGIEAAIKRSFM
jgi:hypothetical protein